MLKLVKNEVLKYQSIDHENIVKFYGSEIIDQHFCIYLEKCHQSLANLLSECGGLSEFRIKIYVKQIVLALEYLHINKIKHLDLKCSNILIVNGNNIKLCDFGSSRDFQKATSPTSVENAIIGSIQWMAPEILKGEGCSR
jgi:mitogen-activated protein kinase kinase kinase 2